MAHVTGGPAAPPPRMAVETNGIDVIAESEDGDGATADLGVLAGR
jgi:hypothetical protein